MGSLRKTVQLFPRTIGSYGRGQYSKYTRLCAKAWSKVSNEGILSDFAIAARQYPLPKEVCRDNRVAKAKEEIAKDT